MRRLPPDHPLPRFSVRLWRIVRLTMYEFLGDRCFDKSASLAYVSLLGIFAVLTVILSVQTMVFPAESQVQRRIENFIFEWFLPTVVTSSEALDETLQQQAAAAVGSPEGQVAVVSAGPMQIEVTPVNAQAQPMGEEQVTEAVREKFKEIIDIFDQFRHSAPTLGMVGILGLVIVSMMLFTSVERSFNEVFHVRRKRPLMRAFATYTAVLVWVPVFVGMTFALSLQAGERLAWMSPGMTALLMTCGTFALAYWFIPNTRVSPVTALIGGLVAGLLWELVKIAFVLYVVKVPTMRNFLLVLGVIPTFLIWLYLTWVVLFLGLEICYVLQHFSPLAGRVFLREPPLELNPRHLVTALYELAQRFESGEPRVTVSDLMAATHLDEQHVHQLLDHCEEQGWVFWTEAHTVYHLARPPEQIRLRDLLLTPVTQVYDMAAVATTSPLEEFWSRYDRAADAALPAKTLKDLVAGTRPQGVARQLVDAS